MKEVNRLSIAVLMVASLTAAAETDAQGSKTGEQFLEEVRNRIRNIGRQELKELLDKEPDVVLIDVRTGKERDFPSHGV